MRGVVINNLGGNKLDYYLTRHIEYSAGGCDGKNENIHRCCPLDE
jgi:hypothetical protein